jgi:hypothetical protein
MEDRAGKAHQEIEAMGATGQMSSRPGDIRNTILPVIIRCPDNTEALRNVYRRRCIPG